MTCKWLSDDFSEICVNGDCPACADFCPCVRYPEICKYSEDGDGGALSPAARVLPHCGGEAFGGGSDDG